MSKVDVSAGLFLRDRERSRILLCHPTNAPWIGTYSIPKGLIEPGEEPLAAALRETLEETGLVIPAEIVGEGGIVDYVDKRGRLFKQLRWFLADVDALELPDILPRHRLQLDEVDWAGFLYREAADAKIFHRFRPMLDLLRA